MKIAGCQEKIQYAIAQERIWGQNPLASRVSACQDRFDVSDLLPFPPNAFTSCWHLWCKKTLQNVRNFSNLWCQFIESTCRFAALPKCSDIFSKYYLPEEIPFQSLVQYQQSLKIRWPNHMEYGTCKRSRRMEQLYRWINISDHLIALREYDTYLRPVRRVLVHDWAVAKLFHKLVDPLNVWRTRIQRWVWVLMCKMYGPTSICDV